MMDKLNCACGGKCDGSCAATHLLRARKNLALKGVCPAAYAEAAEALVNEIAERRSRIKLVIGDDNGKS
jgi:hypothetical protein